MDTGYISVQLGDSKILPLPVTNSPTENDFLVAVSYEQKRGFCEQKMGGLERTAGGTYENEKIRD
jgi:hypothetical protein